MELEIKKITQKHRSQSAIMKQSIEVLGSTLTKKKYENVAFENSGDTLLDTLKILGKFHNINFVKPQIEAKSKDGYNLDEIIEASHIRCRKIKLEDGWHKEDSGPILGFLKNDFRPVALLHLAPESYCIYDSETCEKQDVNVINLNLIESYGYIFYRPFEDKALSVKDVLLYSMNDMWKSDFVKMFIVSLLGGVIALTIPLFSGYLFDSLVPDGNLLGIYQVTLLVLSIILSGAMFQIVKAVSLSRIETKMECNLQAAIWDRLLGLPVTFFKKYSSGNLSNRVMSISKMRRIISGVIVTTIISSLFSLLNLGLLFYYSVELGFVSLILILIFVVISLLIGWKQISFERELIEKNADNTGLLYELISGVLKFKLAGLEEKAFSMWATGFKSESLSRIRSAKFLKLSDIFAATFNLISFVILYYYMIRNFSGGITTGKFIGFMTAFTTFQLAMLSLIKSLLSSSMILVLYDNAKPILLAVPESNTQKAHPGKLSGCIDIKHIDFRYGEHLPLVLKDVSLKIEEGDYIALVGESGSGKSTLFRLLLGFEEAENGKIYYGTKDLSKVDNRAIRKQLGVVLQDGELMSGGICGNIIGSNSELTIDDAWSAAELAGIADDIRDMPMGMNTMISEGVSTISGGQKQRILIARAIANKPKILFFDEATSALDNKTQEVVSESLDSLKTTKIVIAHRLSTIRNCNKIYVMKDGEIVESGTYNDLMKLNKNFAEIANRQLA